MALPERPSPVGKTVSLFVTCMIDMVYPDTGVSVVDILEHLGVKVVFPTAQTCCGQPAFNAGFHSEAKTVAKQYLKAFADAEVIVTPSGSCAAMVRHEYPTLFADDPELLAQAEHLASITWEFTEFLVEGLGVEDLKIALPDKQRFAFHDSCHGLRMLGLGNAGRTLLGNVNNAEIHDLHDSDVCCGFGGLFSVKMPDVSGKMLENKIENIDESSADTIVAGDISCLMHMNGGLSRKESPKRVKHIADVLADALKESKHED